MSLEIYWKKALEQTQLSIDDESLYPLKTDIITRDLYEKDDFIIRKLDTSKFNKKKIYGPKQNPFCPWEKILEIDKIGDNHQLILNKYPVQKGHILLITNEWKPQNGWLDIKDWRAIKQVNKDTSGLWFFNSSPIAGASQPHRHFQLLRRSKGEISCPREKWFLEDIMIHHQLIIAFVLVLFSNIFLNSFKKIYHYHFKKKNKLVITFY